MQAARSIFPLGARGSAGTGQTTCGCAQPGRCAAAYRRIASVSIAPPALSTTTQEILAAIALRRPVWTLVKHLLCGFPRQR